MNFSKFVPFCQVLDVDPDHLLTSVKAPRFTYRALCTSEYCNKIGYGVVRHVERPETICPVCGSYLYWERTAA